MKYIILIASIALSAQENIFLYGDGVQTVKIQNLKPGLSGAGVEFQSHDTSIGGSFHKTGAVYGVFDYASFDQGRITISTRAPGGAAIDTLTAKNGKVGIGTNHPTERLDVAGTVKANAFKVGSGTGITLNCPAGMTIKQVSGGIITDAVCNP